MGLDAVDAAKIELTVGPALAAILYRVLEEALATIGREPDAHASLVEAVP